MGQRRYGPGALSLIIACLVAPAALAVAGACSTGAGPPAPSGTPLPVVTFNPDSGREAALVVEIASSPEERRRGLMGRRSLPADAGMLFVFPEDSEAAFWMKDTLVPLSIAFVSADGRVIGIQDMLPMDETLHYSPAPYRYAIEANQGWFQAHGVTVGDEVRLPPLGGSD